MKSIGILAVFLFLVSCGTESIFSPKPRLYPRVDYPEKNIKTVDLDFCNFKFQFPDYGNPIQDSFYFDESIIDKCWFDIIIESLNGRVHCSYVPVENRAHFDELVNDAYELVVKHNVKANYRDEKIIRFPSSNVYGVQYEIDGQVASPLQFYLTDSTNHFIRGSLYFKDKVNADSIAPIYQFVKADIQEMISSFEWKN